MFQRGCKRNLDQQTIEVETVVQDRSDQLGGIVRKKETLLPPEGRRYTWCLHPLQDGDVRG